MRKKPALTLALTLLALTVIGGGVIASIKHEPGFYRRCAVAPGERRKQLSDEYWSQFSKLANKIIDGRGPWSFAFTQDQINSYFEEDFVRLHDADALAKLGIHAPRVSFDKDSMRLAFRYGSGFWSTVFTYELRMWLVPKEVNTLAVEILHRKAGGMPIAAQSLLTDFKELARKRNIDVSWFRHDGNPVALIRFPSNRNRPNAQLLGFQIVNGQLVIEGQSLEPLQQTMLDRSTPAKS